MISVLQALPIGDAVRAVLAPPEGAVGCRLLRKPSASILTVGDPDATLVWAGSPLDPYAVDAEGLLNGTGFYYRPFYTLDGSTWAAGDVHRTATPMASADAIGPDPLAIVRRRLEAGLEVERVAGRIVGAGRDRDLAIAVLTAPPLFTENLELPLVTVHLRSDGLSQRALGEMIAPDAHAADTGDFYGGEGALCRVELDFAGWVSGNADVRIDLRKALKKVLVGNLPVFEGAGMLNVDLSFNDTEDLESYGSAMFMAMGSISCLVPYAVVAHTPAVTDVSATGVAFQQQVSL